jgi:hypothetical protein
MLNMEGVSERKGNLKVSSHSVGRESETSDSLPMLALSHKENDTSTSLLERNDSCFILSRFGVAVSASGRPTVQSMRISGSSLLSDHLFGNNPRWRMPSWKPEWSNFVLRLSLGLMCVKSAHQAPSGMGSGFRPLMSLKGIDTKR